MNILMLIIVVLIAYFLGNISPATLIGRFYGIDIKKEGSGNAGTTNVLRVLGPKAAIATLAVDILKGYIAVSIAEGRTGNLGAMLAFAAVVLGHIYPVVFKFRGGKGVATFFGAAFAISWPSAFAAAIIAILGAALSKKMSIGSMLAALSYPLLILYYYPKALPIAVLMSVIIVFTHRTNIKRLLRGEEKELSIGSKIKEKTSQVNGQIDDINEKKDSGKVTSESLQEDSNITSIASDPESLEPEEVNELDLEFNPSRVESPNRDDNDVVFDKHVGVGHRHIEIAGPPTDYYEYDKSSTLTNKERKRVAVIGNGSFGTAIANVIANNGHYVTIYGRNKDDIMKMRESHVNSKYLPGALLNRHIRYTSKLKTAASNRDVIVFAIPAQHFREIFKKSIRFIDKETIIVNLAKGVENNSLMTMSEIASKLSKNTYVAISGPSHAEEIVRNYPTTVVAASKDINAAKEVQNLLMRSKFRVYTSDDVIGVELGGALKNVIAIGTGIADGMEFGDNAKAALMTRGIHEISRLGVAMGAKDATFAGLSGIGDLMVTCSSDLSRNRRCGILIGSGLTPDEAVKEIKTTVEGFYTVEAATKLAKKHDIDMPITASVKAVIDGKLEPRDAVELLMGREKKQEN